MAKTEAILELFPAFYRATDANKLLAEVVRALAQPLEEADTHLFRIQRAHRLLAAEHPTDIVRLAAALNLTPFHFEDLLTDEALGDDTRLALMRRRVQRIAGVHLRGLGTPPAVIEAAAIFLDATIVADAPDRPAINHVDPEGYSHRATVVRGQPPDAVRAQIYLHENPYIRRKVEPAPRWTMTAWPLESRNFDAAPLTIAIQGVGDRTVRPSVVCPDAGIGILFNGIVPDGTTLVVSTEHGALLDGEPVDDWLVMFRGGVAGASRANGATSAFSVDTGGDAAPFDGDISRITSRGYRTRASAATTEPGRSIWYFKVTEGIYDVTLLDYSVIAAPVGAEDPEHGPFTDDRVFAEEGGRIPIGIYDDDASYDACLYDYQSSAVVGMAWDERIPCAFKLVLPPVEEMAGESALGLIAEILPRFRAAGVRAFVDTGKDAWVLGQGVLRASAADSTDIDGIDRRTTRLRGAREDSYVAIDVSAGRGG